MIRLTWTTWPRRSSERGERLNSGREARLSGETCRDRQTWTTRSWGPSIRILRSQNFRFKAKIIMGWDWPSFTIAGYYTSRVFQWKKCHSKSKVVEFEPRWISPMDFVISTRKIIFLPVKHRSWNRDWKCPKFGDKSKFFTKMAPHLDKILNDSNQKNSTLANFQLFSSHLVCIDGPIGHKNLSKLTSFGGGLEICHTNFTSTYLNVLNTL